MSKMYTCADVAQRYGVKVITVWDWIRKEKLSAIKIGRDYRVSEEDLKVFEENNRTTRKQSNIS
ncbi:helix-turn-helix domain-containing protein [Blautia liquoris]|uniref:Helix-turn-helix domain-containing protein n=2 Tax=Blautia liquoris TaxID=2779518 RepID=A0A7M2RG00_9FIRM|nr:helix-turn-helix domain-containing protein [Blautia liquoris]